MDGILVIIFIADLLKLGAGIAKGIKIDLQRIIVPAIAGRENGLTTICRP